MRFLSFRGGAAPDRECTRAGPPQINRRGSVFLRQEFWQGAELYVGGFESVDRICQGGNPMRFTHVIECRGERPLLRNRSRHHYEVPADVCLLQFPFTKVFGYLPETAFLRAFTAIVDAITTPGARTLINCKNGRHRSIQFLTLILIAAEAARRHTLRICAPTVQEEEEVRRGIISRYMNFVWGRRHLAEYTCHRSQGMPYIIRTYVVCT